MAVARSFRDLTVWQRSMQMTVAVYRLSQKFPREELYGLTSQMRRSAVSVPSNIAEGHAKRPTRDYQRHLRIAAGSLAEVETQLELLVRLGFVTKDTIRETWMTSQTVAKMLTQLIKSTTMEKPKRPTPNSQLP